MFLFQNLKRGIALVAVFLSVSLGGLTTLWAQSQVSGLVTDPSGEPLIGAGVSVVGSSTGTITDVEGKFTIAATQGQTLRFSYIGFLSVDVKVDGRKTYSVTLAEDENLLDDVVVVGYAVQKKVNLTGSVAAISSKEIDNIPAANTATLLQGRLPGLVLTSNGAQAGNDTPEIRIRGIGTFNNNDPMVIIDGVEGSVSQIQQIPAADIDNISVLKDAASASIYGVRAGNGVIIITTKQGSEGNKPKIVFNASYSVLTHGTIPTYLNSYEWAKVRNEASPTYDEVALEHLRTGDDPDHYANTTWLKELLRTAGMQQYNISVSGGSKTTQYMTSASYSNQDGIMKFTGVERMSFRSNVTTNYKRFHFGINAFGTRTNVTTPAIEVGGGSGLMRNVSWFTRPTVPVKYSSGDYGCVDGSLRSISIKNPFKELTQGTGRDNSWLFNGRGFAALDIWKGLKIQTSLAYVMDENTTKKYSPKSLQENDAEGNVVHAAGKNNTLSDSWSRSQTWTWENILSYNQTFAGKHEVNVLLGLSYIDSRYSYTGASKQGFPTENIYELDGGTLNPQAYGNSWQYNLKSLFGRVNYIYDGRYLFEFNIRRDGSSRIPKEHRYGIFPSVSAGWVFTKEHFMESVTPVMNVGKLRLSWGKLGNQEIGNYAYSATLGATGNYFFDQNADKQAGMVQTSVPNEDIRWETTSSWDVGLDLSFFESRLNASFDWFDKKTTDILMRVSMPGIFLGKLAAPYQNLGAVRNRGWELTMGYQDGKGDWTWNANFSLSRVSNKILELGGLDQMISGETINRVGYPINSLFALKSTGIYRNQAEVEAYKSKDGNIITYNGAIPKPGDIRFEDTDGNGNVTQDDRVIIGNPFPKFSYGFNLGASWKNIDLSTFWQGVAGLNRYTWETTSDIRGNLTERFLDRWSESNPDGSMPRIGNENNNESSSFWMQDASYLRLKNLELGYTFRQSALSKASIESIRLYFTATNLLTFTGYKYWDPEKYSSDSRSDVHPGMRSFSFGVNVQF